MHFNYLLSTLHCTGTVIRPTRRNGRQYPKLSTQPALSTGSFIWTSLTTSIPPKQRSSHDLLKSFLLYPKLRRTRSHRVIRIFLEIQVPCFLLLTETKSCYVTGYQRLKENVTNSKADNHEAVNFFYQVLAVEQVSVNAKEGGNDCCIYLAVEQVYYT